MAGAGGTVVNVLLTVEPREARWAVALVGVVASVAAGPTVDTGGLVSTHVLVNVTEGSGVAVVTVTLTRQGAGAML